MKLRLLVLATTFVLALPATAQDRPHASELDDVSLLLSVINSEIRAQLDQILLLQEAIKANQRDPIEGSGRSPDPITVEDAAALRRRAVQREGALTERLDAVIARSAELEGKKMQLLDRVQELTTPQ